MCGKMSGTAKLPGRFCLNHEVEEEIGCDQAIDYYNQRRNSAAGRVDGGASAAGKKDEWQHKSKSWSTTKLGDDITVGSSEQTIGWRERELFMIEQLKRWEHDPMLQKCYMHKREKEAQQRSKTMPPIPAIKVLAPTLENTQKRNEEPTWRSYSPKQPLSAYSVHYQETGTCQERYWQNAQRLKEERATYAFNHRIHHTGYGLNASNAKPHCVFSPGPRFHSVLSPQTSPAMKAEKIPAKRIRCSTASRNFAVKIPRTPWDT